MTQQQEWAEQNLVAFALGELTPDDEERLRRALSSLPEYEGIFEARSTDEIGHVPPALLARWSQAGRRLRGAERKLVQEHVQACGKCREELSLVGSDVADWLTVQTGAKPQSSNGSSDPTPSSPNSHSRYAAGSFRWIPWVGGGIVGAMAAVLVMLAAPQPGQTPSDAPSLHGQSLPVVTPRALRGNGLDVLEMGQGSPAFLLAMALPTDIRSGANATILVTNPQGTVISRTELEAAPWSPPVAQIVLVSNDLETGVYRVQLQVQGEPEVRTIGSFELRINEQ